jgi:hypothetical protein
VQAAVRGDELPPLAPRRAPRPKAFQPVDQSIIIIIVIIIIINSGARPRGRTVRAQNCGLRAGEAVRAMDLS